MQGRRLKIVIVGHVDHGKSTLIGRILHDTKSLPDGKIEQVKKACDAEGMDFEFAFLLDALLEEQEQNITIDTTQIHFHTPKRNYVIIDAPGHKEFLKNMITGAAAADAAVLMIDAKEGVQEQSRRHGFLLSLLGIRQVIVAVNKMDLVGFDREVFHRIQDEYAAFLKPLGVTPSRFIPISAKNGLNITGKSPELAWYDGPAMVDALDQFTLPAVQTDLPLRLVVQDIYRFDERRIVAGRIEAGTLKVGDELVFWPDRKRSRVKSIESWGAQTPAVSSQAGNSVAITLAQQIFVERGQIASHADEGPIEGRELKAVVFWLHASPLQVGRPYTLKLATQSVEVRLEKIESVMDSSTLEVSGQAHSEVGQNEVAEVIIRSRKPLAFDNSDRIRETGRFVLLEGSRIGGGGVIRGAHYPAATPAAVTSENITWTVGEVTQDSRQSHFGHRGAVLWLTGLSGAGKSTLATNLENTLFRRGIASYILDGDNLRHGLNSNLGFSAEDRKENIRRAAEVARIMADAGLVVIVALISPFREDRQKARLICEEDGIPFAEIFVNAPLTICEERDPRSLYKKARSGEIKGFTGIDAPYEAPENPDLELRTDLAPLEECLGRLVEFTVEKSKPLAGEQPEETAPATQI